MPQKSRLLKSPVGPPAYDPDRGQVTDEEVRDFIRRTWKGAMDEIPELPGDNDNRLWAGFRFPPKSLYQAKARAEIEDVTLTGIMEEALMKYARGRPQEPEAVKQRLERRGIKSVRRSNSDHDS